MTLRKELLTLFKDNPEKIFKVTEIINSLDKPVSNRKRLRNILKQLKQEGKIHRFKKGRWGLLQNADLLTGTISIASKGYGFLRPEPPAPGAPVPPDVFITQRNLKSAMQGDRVIVSLLSGDRERPSGRVVKILHRARTQLAGRFHFAKKGGTVVPSDRKINRMVYIPQIPFRQKLQDGTLVMVTITDYGDFRNDMTGEISEILGKEDEPGMDVFVIIRDYGIEPEFSDNVLRSAETIPGKITESEITERKDLRKETIFTIDPKTAKDFDDGLSIEKRGDGGFHLGVHIADVAHYVKEGDVIDQEALSRANSIYPVDRVVPMLPERLSNNLCSLRPEEDKLAMSVFMDIDPQGKVRHAEFYNSVIHSKYRMNYEEVQEIYDGENGELEEKYSAIREDLFLLRELTRILIRMRWRKGALDLDVGELEVVFDDAGEVIDITTHPRLFSHRVVEQSMILANETVASKLHRMKVPSLYRVHEKPDQNRIHNLIPVLEHFGIQLPRKRNVTPKQIQRVLKKTEEMGHAGPILRRLILRVMMQAHYQPENVGHYGLGSNCYTHFTSPIRRYPDLVVHRMLKRVLAGKHRNDENLEKWEEPLANIAQHCSEMERVAQNIEYETEYIKALEFMKQFTGEEFEGVISSVTNFGLFVEMDKYPVEGLVQIKKIGSEYFEYDDVGQVLKGKRSGKTYRIADRVTVQIERIDVIERKMDLSLIDTKS